MIPTINPCGYLWANQGTQETYFQLRPKVHFAQPIWFLLPLVCCFWTFSNNNNNMHETLLFGWKNIFWNKKHTFFETKNMFFKEKRYLKIKKSKKNIAALKGCWKFVANFQSNFQGGLQVWLKFSMKTFRVGLNVSMQIFKAGLKVSCQLAGLHWIFFLCLIECCVFPK